ncbi:hypothetical protein SAMN04488591_2045 [Microbacterium azadirachtae]|uniref:Uncharacterized protein n=1 Tax=Microbacterium azadirachtae TaxID=582680 RepID=A0A1I6HR67_9MICO|nr:hypothetical protein [Microbacterium azadirachtae]SFR56946.1 hypothetical protein SAMN04488591_2045 [Microbacterium azadirachtae]
MSIEYAAFYRGKITLTELGDHRFDLFLSSLNKSVRVRTLEQAITATRKLWIVHDEYCYTEAELSGLDVAYAPHSHSPAESWAQILSGLGNPVNLAGLDLGIDITGMMRPHIAMLPYALAKAGAQTVTVFYSDPDSYVSGERTEFTRGPVRHVGLIPGMEGGHSITTSPRDALIIGAGYDNDLVKAVADDKPNAEHVILLGLPSLQPHMYQESVLKLEVASESIQDYYLRDARIFAPASDPFATAQVISDKVHALGELDHLYLTAVGAKPQVLGFAWYYWCEAAGTHTSFLFPFADGYERQTSNGIATIHEYRLELDAVRRPDLTP